MAVFYNKNTVIGMSNIGNVNNFTGASRFKTFYLKLTQKNKLHIIIIISFFSILLTSIILLQPKVSILGPSISNKTGKIGLEHATCISYKDCKLKTLSNDGNPISLSLPSGSAISVVALDPEYKTVLTEAKIHNDGWLLTIPKGEILLTITQGSDQYQAKLK